MRRQRSFGVSRPNPTLNGLPLDNSASGSRVKRCAVCSRANRQTKEAIASGLQIIRVRYGIPYSELPVCEPSDLGRFHLFLLGTGKERTSVNFPRRQKKQENSDLCNLQRLWRHERWELALSVASIKRGLPTGCVHHTPTARNSWESFAFSQPPPSTPEYLDFARRESALIFSHDWDRSYYSFVRSHVPNPTARLPPKSRADSLWAGRREEFLLATTQDTEVAQSFAARYKEVPSAGKCRPLLIYDESIDLLAPLHKTMYRFLCTKDWLLCGPPTERRVASVCANEYQTSVDLVSATDGLSHDIAKVILDVAFTFARKRVPRGIRALAYASLTPLVLESSGKVVDRVRHGQMMGAYLSFPLLCIQSYIAARWATRDCIGARYLVNGDDTLISTDRPVTSADYPKGFRLNVTKTIVSKNTAEINSTVFLRGGGKWREVRHLRRGGHPSTYEGIRAMAKACSSRPCWSDAFIRSRVGTRWGFLPSQLKVPRTYVVYCRQRTMTEWRSHTDLPWYDDAKLDERLRWVACKRDPSPEEKEALTSCLFQGGRSGGLKRDVISLSQGELRKTFHYVRKWRSCGRRFFSYLTWSWSMYKADSSSVGQKRAGFYLPWEAETEEEKVASMRGEWLTDSYVRYDANRDVHAFHELPFSPWTGNLFASSLA